MKKLVALLLLILSIGIIYWWRLPSTVKGPSSGQKFEYIVRISGDGDSSDALPMIIALHGNGDVPANFFDTLLKDFNYPARFIVMRGLIDVPSSFLSGRGWPMDDKELSKCGDDMADAVSVLLERYPTKGQPLVLGFSSGAFVAYYLAAFHADRFSYIFPISGRLSGNLLTAKTVSHDNGARVIALHSKGDGIITFSSGIAAVESLKKIGLNAEMVTFDGGHTDIFRSGKPILLNHLSDAVNEIAP
jgi:phospholipase/carboxylesterase